MSSVAQSIIEALAARIIADIPALTDRIHYDYYMDAVAGETDGLPYANILYLGETIQFLSNQVGGLTIVEAHAQVDYYVALDSMDADTGADRVIGLDACADLRLSILSLVYRHVTGSTVISGVGMFDLVNINVSIATVRTLSTPHVCISIKPEFRYERAYNQR